MEMGSENFQNSAIGELCQCFAMSSRLLLLHDFPASPMLIIQNSDTFWRSIC